MVQRDWSIFEHFFPGHLFFFCCFLLICISIREDLPSLNCIISRFDQKTIQQLGSFDCSIRLNRENKLSEHVRYEEEEEED